MFLKDIDLLFALIRKFILLIGNFQKEYFFNIKKYNILYYYTYYNNN